MSISPTDITDAALRVLVARGLDAVSIRTVATEAGVAPRTVQYHMGTKEDLLAKTFLRSIDRQVERVAQPSEEKRILPLMARRLLELLPIGEVQREDAAAWVIFGAAASTRPTLKNLYMDALADFQNTLHQSYVIAKDQKLLNPNFSPVEAARLTTALVNGLTLDHLNVDNPDPQKIRADLIQGLRLILTEED